MDSINNKMDSSRNGKHFQEYENVYQNLDRTSRCRTLYSKKSYAPTVTARSGSLLQSFHLLI